MSRIADYLQGTRFYNLAVDLRRRIAASPLSRVVQGAVFAALGALAVATSFGWLLVKYPGSAPGVLSFVVLVAVVGWIVWPRAEIRAG